VLSEVKKANVVSEIDLAVATAAYPHPEIVQAASLYRAANTALAQARSRETERVVHFTRF
jgi:hypothetical protein